MMDSDDRAIVLSATTHSPVNPMCTIELKKTANKKAIFCFRAPRTIIKSESYRCALSSRFSSISRRSANGERESEKGRNENVTLDDARNRRLIGSSESQNARFDPARPGIACCNVDSEGMEAGLGASRCSWDGVPPRPLVIHEAPLEIERHSETLPGTVVELSIVWQLLQRIRAFIRFPRLLSHDFIRDRNEIEKRH